MKETDVAKSYLRQILKIDKLINRLIDTVSTLRKSLTSISCEIKERVQTSGPKDTAAGTIAKIVDMENEINERIDELVDLKREAFRMISKISDFDQQNVLIARYIQLKSWDDIAFEMDCSIQWLFEIHKKGITDFYRLNKEFFKD